MEATFLNDLDCLTMAQKMALAKGKVQTVGDLLLTAPKELAKKCKIPSKEVEVLVDLVCKEFAPEPRTIRELAHLGEEKFTTGDSHIDEVLGGGIRTGMVWEISGENNAGKTQLALQLSLTVQLPQRLGGLSGAACYITTREDLLTPRIQQIVENHPLLSPEFCGFPDIHAVKAPAYVALQKVLSESIHTIADQRAHAEGAKPVKLIIIDTLSDVFDERIHEIYEDKPLRARHLKQLSLLLHQLASKYRLSVVVLGATRNTRPRIDGGDKAPGELRYSDQERWFARAHTLRGEDAHEAILGHVWPNQLNARIMMSRTIRTRPRSAVHPRAHECEAGRAPKRQRLEGPEHKGGTLAEDELVPLRRFSVIFSSVGPPGYCDYVIFDEGVVGIPAEEQPPSTFIYATPPSSAPQSVPPSLTPGTSSSGLTQDTGLQSIAPSGSSGHQPRYLQSLSYASTPPSIVTPIPPSLPTASSSQVDPSSAPSASSSQQHPQSQQTLSDANIATSRVITVPPSQSVVPSSQPDQDEDWDMYWKDTQDQDDLYASVADRIGGAERAEAIDNTEAAEAGPPVENDPDSDYYWDENDDTLYAEL